MPRDPEPKASGAPVVADLWAPLRRATPARIGLARAGDALALRHVLELQAGHAKARDAVHVPLDVDVIASQLAGRATIRVRSQAADRSTYLRRPDLGRKLDTESRAALAPGSWDVVFVIADGLSSAAVARNAVPLLDATLARLDGWSVAPIVLATQARVALADEIGERLGAVLSVILIGERPGLSADDSLGAYITFGPRPGRRDSERNCLSNIRAGGLPPEVAAARLVWLLNAARRRGLTGVALKDESRAVASGRSDLID